MVTDLPLHVYIPSNNTNFRLFLVLRYHKATINTG
jgi:hypothetical protein